MTETCPYCGSPGPDAMTALYREVARIRELAEQRHADSESGRDAARIAELTREIRELRATVARLRSAPMPGLAHSV